MRFGLAVKRVLYVVAFSTLLWVPSTVIAASPSPPDKVLDHSYALGFLFAQTAHLEAVRSKYPELIGSSLIAENAFRASFGNAERNIRQALKQVLGKHYDEYVSKMMSSLLGAESQKEFGKRDAIRFIEDVKARGNGELEPRLLRTLLKAQFRDEPASELIHKFYQTFRTTGHRKSKGLSIQIEYPQSWVAREGKRPNVVQVFAGEGRHAIVQTLIMIRNFAAEMGKVFPPEILKELQTLEGSQEFAVDMFSRQSVTEMIDELGMKNPRQTSYKRIVIDRWPGVMYEVTGEQQRLDVTLSSHQRMYTAIYKGFMIFFQCSVTKRPGVSEADFQKSISLYSPLFHLMANSIVILDQY